MVESELFVFHYGIKTSQAAVVIIQNKPSETLSSGSPTMTFIQQKDFQNNINNNWFGC